MSFLLPTTLADADELIKRCKGCQFFAKQQHVLACKLVTIPPAWPFAYWGLDMTGPLITALGGFNRVLVAIDKFTKWIEVKPVTCPKADKVIDFLDELEHHYGLPIASSQIWAPTSTTISSRVLREQRNLHSICLSYPPMC
jgi:hypothetical protein